MNKRLQGFVAGILCCVLFAGISVFAKNTTETIQALYKDIKIYVDGVKIDPKDANGNTVEPFIYNGTTYLPVRAVGEAINKQVTWDGATSSVYLGEKPGDTQYLMEIKPPYGGEGYNTYFSNKGEFLSIGGTKYTNGIKLRYSNGFALFNIDGKYNSMTFIAGRPDEDNIVDTTVNFYVDDKLVKSINISGDALPQKHTVSLNHGLQLKIQTDNDDIGIMDIVLN